MVTIPRIVKPHYSIQEAIGVIQRAGLGEFTQDELLYLSENGSLEMSLLVDESITLVNANYATPIDLQRDTPYEILDDDAIFFTLDLNNGIGELKKIASEINYGIPLIPHFVLEMGNEEKQVNFSTYDELSLELKIITQATERNELKFINKADPIVIKPVKIPYEQNWQKFEFQTLDDLGAKKQIHEGYLIGIMISEELYFPVKKRTYYFDEKIKLKIEFQNGVKFTQRFFLDNDLMQRLILKQSFVITRESMLAFITEKTGDSPLRVNKSKQELREESLKDLIIELGMAEVISLGREGTWNVLRGRNSLLFPISSRDTLKQFFRVQKLITYSPGRRLELVQN